MPRSAAVSVENNFSRGLITEATAMNYPENSVVETENCVYLKSGTVLRRNGVDFEDGAVVHTFENLGVLANSVMPDYDNVAIGEFEWVTLNENANKSFYVTQIGDVIRFFEVDDTNTISPNLKPFSVRISDYRTTPNLQTEVAHTLGTVLVTNTSIAAVTQGLTFAVTKGTKTRTIVFGSGVGEVDTLAEFVSALNEIAVSLSMIVTLQGGYLYLSALSNDNEGFTVSGSVNTTALFGIAKTTYLSDTEDAYEAVARRKCSFSTGQGYLFIVHPFCEPVYVRYDQDTDDIETKQINIKARDFERLDDGLAVDERPPQFSVNIDHYYNLFNQGWYAEEVKRAGSGLGVSVYGDWVGAKLIQPSNSDVWWLWKNASDEFDPVNQTFAQLAAPAANGHYIYNAFQTDRRNATGTVLDGIEERSSGPFRPSATAFFSSRVWYSGITVDGFSSNIYFSKLIEGPQDFGTCYQATDPTSEDYNELVEIDGGVVVIPEAVRITGLVALGKALIVFASNGVWTISGTQGGFKANDYNVQKISSSPVTSPTSIVIAENRPFWWSRSGIYTVIVDTNSGELSVENISDITIKKLTLSVPAINVEYIKGVYNTVDRTIQWLYRIPLPEEDIESYQYTDILVHDILSKSFYTHRMNESTKWISGGVSTSKSTFDPLSNDDSGSTSAYVTTGDFGPSGARSITISKFRDTNFVDWNESSFESYFITGYRVRAELLRKFQANYVVVMSKMSNIPEEFEDYSVLISGVWDYGNSTGRTTIPQQVYKWDYNRDYSRRKLKMRGNGYSLQYKFSSVPNKKFILVGWVSSESASNVP